MPRKPKATRPKAKTDDATIRFPSPCRLTQEPTAISSTIVNPR